MFIEYFKLSQKIRYCFSKEFMAFFLINFSTEPFLFLEKLINIFHVS